MNKIYTMNVNQWIELNEEGIETLGDLGYKIEDIESVTIEIEECEEEETYMYTSINGVVVFSGVEEENSITCNMLSEYFGY